MNDFGANKTKLKSGLQMNEFGVCRTTLQGRTGPSSGKCAKFELDSRKKGSFTMRVAQEGN